MDGTVFAQTIRQVLNDNPTINYQGRFWADYEIRLALNLSQFLFIQYALALRQYHLLYRLLSETPYSASPDTFFQNPGNPRLLYPMKALVGVSENQLKRGRIFWGDGISNFDNGQAGCFIVNDILIYRERDNLTGRSNDTGGKLIFLQYPSHIYLSTDNSYVPVADDNRQDFSIDIYQYYIVPYACVILGMKEITNQRDFKLWKNFVKSMFAIPKEHAHFLMDYEFTGQHIKVGRPPSQDIEGENA